MTVRNYGLAKGDTFKRWVILVAAKVTRFGFWRDEDGLKATCCEQSVAWRMVVKSFACLRSPFVMAWSKY